MNKTFDKNKRSFLFSYTLIFLFISVLFAYLFYSQGRSLINYSGDGYREYYKTLIYYSRHLRTIIHNIFVSHSFEIPMFEMAIGDGSDIIQTFHFVGVGEPFTFFSFLFKEEHMYIFYDLMIFARLYCSGLAFSYLCYTFNTNHKWQGVLAGTIAYVFCNYSVTSATTHPFFLNPLIWFPLIIAGVEKVINNRKPFALILSVFFAAVSNIYFFYMCVVLTVIYGVVRVAFVKKTFKDALITLFIVAGYSLLGVLLGGVMFMPMFYALITNSRMSVERVYMFFTTLEGYKNFIYSLVIGNTWYFGGYSPLIVFALIAFFKDKKDKTISSLLIIAAIFCLFPICGQFMNAMTYATDRWMFGLAPLMCYIIVYKYDSILNLNSSKYLYLSVLVIFYLACVILNKDQLQIHVMFAIVSLFAVAVSCLLKNKGLLNLTYIGITVFVTCFILVYWFSPIWWNKAKEGTKLSTIKETLNDESFAIKEIGDNEFWRYGGDNLETNSSLFSGHSGSQFYWSVSNNYVAEFRKEIGLSDRSTIHYDNYDDRYALLALASEKYFVSSENNLIPYGYEFFKNIENYDIYKSNNSLPLVYGYKDYISYSDFLKLGVDQKNELISKTAVLEIENPELKCTSLNYETKTIESSLSCDDGMQLQNNVISVKTAGSTAFINIDSQLNGEYYLIVEGLDSDISSYINVETSNTNKTINYKDRSHPRYSNRHDFVICLGAYEGYKDTIAITFPNTGEFAYQSIKIACMPIKSLLENINSLNNVLIKDYSIGTNSVNAEIELEEKEIVCFSIPYSKGWNARVDGKKYELINVNIKNIGLILDKGEHQIELTYETPLLKIGFVSTIIASIVCVAIIKRTKKDLLNLRWKKVE